MPRSVRARQGLHDGSVYTSSATCTLTAVEATTRGKEFLLLPEVPPEKQPLNIWRERSGCMQHGCVNEQPLPCVIVNLLANGHGCVAGGFQCLCHGGFIEW
jgi:hypothetical protein